MANKRADLITGRAKITGLSRDKFRKLSGMSQSTFDRRMKDPDRITLGELRRFDQLAHFEDSELVSLVRSK